MPMLNIRRMTPNSDIACVKAAPPGPAIIVQGTCGPNSIPASKWPKMGGCLKCCETRLVIAAVPRTTLSAWR